MRIIRCSPLLTIVHLISWTNSVNHYLQSSLTIVDPIVDPMGRPNGWLNGWSNGWPKGWPCNTLARSIWDEPLFNSPWNCIQDAIFFDLSLAGSISVSENTHPEHPARLWHLKLPHVCLYCIYDWYVYAYCIHICIQICTVYIYIYISIWLCSKTYLYKCIYIYGNICMYTGTFTSIHTLFVQITCSFGKLPCQCTNRNCHDKTNPCMTILEGNKDPTISRGTGPLRDPCASCSRCRTQVACRQGAFGPFPVSVPQR